MSRGFDAYSGKDAVGYKRPPRQHRFSTTNQPIRLPRAMPSERNTTMRKLDEELIGVMQPDGSRIQLKGRAVVMERQIDLAFSNNMRAARRLYEQLDREAAEWIASPRYKARKPTAEERSSLSRLARLMLPDVIQLIELGLVVRVHGDEFAIAPWVQEACDRQHGRSA